MVTLGRTPPRKERLWLFTYTCGDESCKGDHYFGVFTSEQKGVDATAATGNCTCNGCQNATDETPPHARTYYRTEIILDTPDPWE